jgi:hypothetical protein
VDLAAARRILEAIGSGTSSSVDATAPAAAAAGEGVGAGADAAEGGSMAGPLDEEMALLLEVADRDDDGCIDRREWGLLSGRAETKLVPNGVRGGASGNVDGTQAHSGGASGGAADLGGGVALEGNQQDCGEVSFRVRGD